MSRFQPTLWDAVANGNQIAANVPAQVIVAVTNGLFTLPLDFGANFPGADRWLQLEVRTAIGSFTLLTPRQQLTSTPYAITAGNFTGTIGGGSISNSAITSLKIADGSIVNSDINVAAGITDVKLATISTVGKVANSATTATSSNVPSAIVERDAKGNFSADTISAAFVGDGAGLTNVKAASLSGVTSNGFWRTTGNAGTSPTTFNFLGTTDFQPFEIKVGGSRALRIEPTFSGANMIGGAAENRVQNGVVGATISGGGGGGIFNRVNADYSSIGGGRQITIESVSFHSTIAGGRGNTIQSNSMDSTISGGRANLIDVSSPQGTIAGGRLQLINELADAATIGGGSNNVVLTNGDYATIPGGADNVATNYGFAAGRRAKANHTGAFVWADSTDADVASTATNQFTIRAGNGVRLTEEAGSAKTIAVGEHYRDNAIVAWGRCTSSGVVSDNRFGVASVTRNGVGRYDIVLTASASSSLHLIPVAIAEIELQPTTAATARIVSVNQTGTSTFSVFINSGTFAAVDNDFVFMVTAR